MLFIKGVRNARIKTYQVHKECKNCRAFDLSVGIFHDYYHVFYVPVVPVGAKSSIILCNRCGIQMGSADISDEYEAMAKIPFYLYTALLLLGVLVIAGIYESLSGQHDRQMYIADPRMGDVYLREQKVNGIDEYSFLRVEQVAGDSVTACYNHLTYLSSPSGFSPEDYFDTKMEAILSKAHLKQLFEKDTIETIYRDYATATGFNRMK